VLPSSNGGQTLFFVVRVRGANIYNVDFWIDIDITVVGVDFGLDGIWRRGWEDGGEETGAFLLGGCSKRGDFMIGSGGGTGEEEVGSEAGGDPAGSCEMSAICFPETEGRNDTENSPPDRGERS